EELLDEQPGPDGKAILRVELEHHGENGIGGREPDLLREKSDVMRVFSAARGRALHRQQGARVRYRDGEVAQRAPTVELRVLRHECLRGVVEPIVGQAE